jgi:hypothetical protein
MTRYAYPDASAAAARLVTIGTLVQKDERSASIAVLAPAPARRAPSLHLHLDAARPGCGANASLLASNMP